jgi:hypothetical protein
VSDAARRFGKLYTLLPALSGARMTRIKHGEVHQQAPAGMERPTKPKNHEPISCGQV